MLNFWCVFCFSRAVTSLQRTPTASATPTLEWRFCRTRRGSWRPRSRGGRSIQDGMKCSTSRVSTSSFFSWKGSFYCLIHVVLFSSLFPHRLPHQQASGSSASSARLWLRQVLQRWLNRRNTPATLSGILIRTPLLETVKHSSQELV